MSWIGLLAVKMQKKKLKKKGGGAEFEVYFGERSNRAMTDGGE